MAKVGAHKIEASNLLKLKCKINNKLMFCLLDLGVTNLVMTSQITKTIGSQDQINGKFHNNAFGTRHS
jgi:hypothetical protein